LRGRCIGKTWLANGVVPLGRIRSSNKTNRKKHCLGGLACDRW
jgi:hypothetical protein